MGMTEARGGFGKTPQSPDSEAMDAMKYPCRISL
jgi:hypothetical protein